MCESNPNLISQVVGSFYKEIKEKKTENERLQHVYQSEKEMYNRRMEEVETEIDIHLKQAERKAREEVGLFISVSVYGKSWSKKFYEL